MNIDYKELNQVYTFAEAAKLYNLRDGSTLRKAVQNGRFKDNEIKKVGTTWVVTKEAMDRLYGVKQSSITDRVAAAKMKAAAQENKPIEKDKNKER